MQDPRRPIQLFVSYSTADEPYPNSLLEQLTPFLKTSIAYKYTIWRDRDALVLGEEWHVVIKNAIGNSTVGLLLLSPNFLNSVYIIQEEIPDLLKKVVAPARLKPFDDKLQQTFGLMKLQHFLLSRPGAARLTYLECKDDEQRHAFALDLFRTIEKALGARQEWEPVVQAQENEMAATPPETSKSHEILTIATSVIGGIAAVVMVVLTGVHDSGRDTGMFLDSQPRASSPTTSPPRPTPGPRPELRNGYAILIGGWPTSASNGVISLKDKVEIRSRMKAALKIQPQGAVFINKANLIQIAMLGFESEGDAEKVFYHEIDGKLSSTPFEPRNLSKEPIPPGSIIDIFRD